MIKPQREPRYYAIDSHTPVDTPKYLKYCCTKFTDRKHDAWIGTETQYINMVETFEWDALKRIPATI